MPKLSGPAPPERHRVYQNRRGGGFRCSSRLVGDRVFGEHATVAGHDLVAAKRALLVVAEWLVKLALTVQQCRHCQRSAPTGLWKVSSPCGILGFWPSPALLRGPSPRQPDFEAVGPVPLVLLFLSAAPREPSFGSPVRKAARPRRKSKVKSNVFVSCITLYEV